jgi:predicted glycosyltransferase
VKNHAKSPKQNTSKTILVAPLNWGLGHAARCIPIIRSLLQNNFSVLLGSDGSALALMRLEFPDLDYVLLPEYHITYPDNAKNLKAHLISQIPSIFRAMREEKVIVGQLVAQGRIDGVISDNRFGVRHKDIPSVFVSHQIRVLSGWSTFITSFAHQQIIKKFDQCWVPDYPGKENLSGAMGHVSNWQHPMRYLGPLSRMKPFKTPIEYDLLILLSGPEPQRTLLEQKLVSELQNSSRRILMVRGVVTNQQQKEKQGVIQTINFLTSAALEQAINSSTLILCRSGYTNIIDLSILQKKVFFIPTPGQYEQEYLARRLKRLNQAAYCHQDDFKETLLNEVDRYEGLHLYAPQLQDSGLKLLFGIF